jgi:hypothetical protein
VSADREVQAVLAAQEDLAAQGGRAVPAVRAVQVALAGLVPVGLED